MHTEAEQKRRKYEEVYNDLEKVKALLSEEMRKYEDLRRDFHASEEIKARIEQDMRSLENELNYYRNSVGDREAADKAELADLRALIADLRM